MNLCIILGYDAFLIKLGSGLTASLINLLWCVHCLQARTGGFAILRARRPLRRRHLISKLGKRWGPVRPRAMSPSLVIPTQDQRTLRKRMAKMARMAKPHVRASKTGMPALCASPANHDCKATARRRACLQPRRDHLPAHLRRQVMQRPLGNLRLRLQAVAGMPDRRSSP